MEETPSTTTVSRVELIMPVTRGTAEDHKGDLFTVGEVWWIANAHGINFTAFGHTSTGESTNATFYPVHGDETPDWVPRPPAAFRTLAALITEAGA